MKKHLKLIAMLAVVGTIFAFTACDDKEDPKPDPTPVNPNPNDSTKVIPKMTINISFEGTADTGVSKFGVAYQDTNYRFYFGPDSTVANGVNANHTLCIATAKLAGIKTTYNAGEVARADYWISANNKSQQFQANMGTLTIDSISASKYISGKFDLKLLSVSEGAAGAKRSLTGTFINIPLNK